MMSTKAKKTNSKIKKYFKAPVKVLGKARDLYVRSLSNCAGHISYGIVGGSEGLEIPPLRRSFSVDSGVSRINDKELIKFIRTASKRGLDDKIDFELLQLQEAKRSSSVNGDDNGVIMPRSNSVAVGRIDEDKPAEFGDVKGNPYAYSRSKSYAVSHRRMMM